MDRNRLVFFACGPHNSGSSEMPWLLEKRCGSRSAAWTSAWRDSAQKSRSSLR